MRGSRAVTPLSYTTQSRRAVCSRPPGGHGARRPPAASETVDWARTLAVLGVDELDATVLRDTASVVLKYERDLAQALGVLPRLLDPNREPPDLGRDHDHEHDHEHRLAQDDGPAGREVRVAKDRPGRHDEG